jgi:chromosome segregation ATPase
MFYMLVFSGIGFFAFGVVATLFNSYNMQKEYDMLTTELVRTDNNLKELEVKYDRSQSELKAFKLRIEASKTWTTEDLGETHGHLEKLRAEYVRVKVKTGNNGGQYPQELKEKCKNLLAEAEEHNKLISERNKELISLRMTFDNMKTQLEESQRALKETHERLRSIQPGEEAQEKIKEVVSEIKSLEDAEASQQKAVAAEKQDPPQDGQPSEKEHLETMRSFLSSLDNNSTPENERGE